MSRTSIDAGQGRENSEFEEDVKGAYNSLQGRLNVLRGATMHDDGLQRLEQRLNRVEQEIEALKSSIARAQHPWWDRTAGMFKDDPLFENLMRQVRRLRKDDYANARSAPENAVANPQPGRKAPRNRRAS